MRTIFGSAMLLITIYSAFLHSLVRSQSQWQDNPTILERFETAPADVESVYLGSSLTGRLPVDAMSRCAFNLAVGGNSAFPRARQVQAAFEDAFPSHPVVKSRTVADLGATRALDSVHLDPVGAKRVATYVQERFPAHCGSSSAPAGKR